MKFIGKIATGQKDSQGEVLSEEALQQLAETAVGKQLSYEFKHDLPGKITNAWIEEGSLFVEGELELYAVPGFSRSKGSEKLTMFSVGLTDKPADPHVTPIKWRLKE